MPTDEKIAEDLKLTSEAPQLVAAKYELDHKIGTGGLGVVYAARQLSTGKKVAIKFVKCLDEGSSILVRFKQEAQALSTLSHPNIVSIIDFSAEEDPFLVMDFIDGLDLKAFINRQEKPDLLALREIFKQVCRGLTHAHSKGIVHRDLKPSNIMIQEPNPGEIVVKIVDFGIASNQSSAVKATQTGDVVGSPAYVSPEQAQGFKTDARSDIYSLGCLMYEALTGRLPFEADTALAAIMMRLSQDPPEFKADGLEHIVLKAMERNVENRYQTALELENELSLSEADLKVLRKKEWARRNSKLVLKVLTGLMLALGSTLWILFDGYGTEILLKGLLNNDSLLESKWREEMAKVDRSIGAKYFGTKQVESAVKSLFRDFDRTRDIDRAKRLVSRTEEISQRFSLAMGDLPKYQKLLGNLLVEEHKPDEAEAAYRKYWQLTGLPSDVLDTVDKLFKESWEFRLTARKEKKSQLQRTQLQKAESLYLQGVALLTQAQEKSVNETVLDTAINSLRHSAEFYYEQKRFGDSVKLLERARNTERARSSPLRQALISLELAESYRWSGQPEKAQELYMQAERMAAEGEDPFWQGASLAMLAETASFQEDYAKANWAAEKGLKLMISANGAYDYIDYIPRLLPHAFELCAKSYVDQLRPQKAFAVMNAGYIKLNEQNLWDYYLKNEEHRPSIIEFLKHFELVLNNAEVQKLPLAKKRLKEVKDRLAILQ